MFWLRAEEFMHEEDARKRGKLGLAIVEEFVKKSAASEINISSARQDAIIRVAATAQACQYLNMRHITVHSNISYYVN